MDLKDLKKEVDKTVDSHASHEIKAAYIIAQSNLELAKSNLMIAEAQRSVATAIEEAGNAIASGLAQVSSSIDGIS